MSTALLYDHTDSRECLKLPDQPTWNYLPDPNDETTTKACKRKHLMSERTREIEWPPRIMQGANPPEGKSFIDIPKAGIRWPVPTEVAVALEGLVQELAGDAQQNLVKKLLEDLTAIHFPVAGGKKGDVCMGCSGRKSFPCETVKLVASYSSGTQA